MKNKKVKYGIIAVCITVVIAFVCYFVQVSKRMSIEKEYRQNLFQVVELVDEHVDVVDDSVNLLMDVWHDAIWQNDNENTKKYVFQNDVAVDDFNDALRALYRDSKFDKTLTELSDFQVELKLLQNELHNVDEKYIPEEFVNLGALYDELINVYDDIVSTLVNVNGSYQSLEKKFDKLYEQLNDIYADIKTEFRVLNANKEA